MTDALAVKIARIVADPSLTLDAAIEKAAQAIVERSDSTRVVAIAWSLLGAVQREGEIDWACEGLDTAAQEARLEEITEHVLVAMRGLSSSEAGAVLFKVVPNALAGMSDATFEEWIRLVKRLRKARAAPLPSVN